MPKQKHANFKRYQGTSSSSAKPSKDAVPSRSVNAILGELRIADERTANAIKQRLSENAKSTSLPPEVGRLVDPSAQPAPLVPVARPFARARRFAGPAPPRSWLRGDLSGSSGTTNVRVDSKALQDRRDRQLFRFEKLCDGGHESAGLKSLQHLSMKVLATHWHDLDPTHYEALAELLPLSTRLDLLSHLGTYADSIDLEAFRALISGDTPLDWLDLAGLLNKGSMTTKALIRLIRKERREHVHTEPQESWDEEPPLHLPAAPSGGKFLTLTHLCLSHPDPSVRWDDLIQLTKLTPALTHLSIAYWPQPTMTPNLMTTTVTHSHGAAISAGGTHFYSELDGDHAEAAALLRQLSANTLRLRWLDIEGVPTALMALAANERRTLVRQQPQRGWSLPEQHESGIIGLKGTWKNLAYIRVAGDSKAPRPKGATIYNAKTVHLNELLERGATLSEQEQIFLTLCQDLEAWRRAASCAPVIYDLGWNWKLQA